MRYPVAEINTMPVYMVASSDGITPVTGLAYTDVTVSYQKVGGILTTKSLSASDWTEVGVGLYDLSFTVVECDTSGDFCYTVLASGTVQYVGLVQLDDWGSHISAIGAAAVTITAPMTAAGDMTVIQGDDYLLADGRQFDWTDSTSIWPTITGATVTWHRGSVSHACTVVVGSGAGKKVRLELGAVDSAALLKGKINYYIRAVLTDLSVVTLAKGACTVTEAGE